MAGHEPAPETGLEPAAVLLVDDDAATLRMFGLALTRRGHAVATLHHAFGVLNAIARHRPRVVLLDVMMPGLDGPGIVELIHRDPEFAGVRVILISALDEPILAQRAASCRADGYFAKTLGAIELTRRVARWLQD